jgi:hypothetical protein
MESLPHIFVLSSNVGLFLCYASKCVAKRRKGETKEGEERKQRSTRREQSRPHNTSRRRTQCRQQKPHRSTNQPEQRKGTITHGTSPKRNQAPKGHPRRHQTEIHNSGTKPRNKDKRKAPCPGRPRRCWPNPDARTGGRQAPAARGHTAHQCRGRKGIRPPQGATRSGDQPTGSGSRMGSRVSLLLRTHIIQIGTVAITQSHVEADK